MLRIADSFQASDLGRQRQGNEDNFYVRAPLFAVADGMGGAQAGEVASEMAVHAFRRGLPDDRPPAESLARVIEEANRQIHRHAQGDADRQGMGTTVTAAYVTEDEEVVIAHVGDSRAYLLRDGDLIRLTRDHSLVEELIAQGKLTEEQAESHPQRSVITRALGPEPQVQVDVQAYQARDGDLFLICSDGLTSMVAEGQVRDVLQEHPGLDEAGRRLIDAANAAGGRDNITVVLFRLEEAEHAGGDPAAASETLEHDVPAAGGAGAATSTMARPQPRAEALPDPGAQASPLQAPGPVPSPPPRRRRRRRVPGVAVGAAVLLLMLVAGFWTSSRAVYFLGVDEATNAVTIYRGLPYELPFGLELYERFYTTGVTLEQVPAAQRDSVTDHQLRPKDDAEDLAIALEEGRLE